MEEIIKKVKTPFNWRRFWVILITTVVGIVVVFGILVGYTYSYNKKVLPGVYLGKIPIAGMEAGELREFMDKMNDKLVDEGLTINYKTVDKEDSFKIYPVLVSESNSLELVRIDVDAEVKYLIDYGKAGNVFSRIGSILKARLSYPNITLHNIEIDETRLLEMLGSELSQYETQPQDAGVEISSIEPLQYEITSSTDGVIYDYKSILGQVVNSWEILQVAEDLQMEQSFVESKVKKEDVEKIEDRLGDIFDDGGLNLQYTDPHTRWEYEWWISLEQIKTWLNVQPTVENGFGFGLDDDELIGYLKDTVAIKVNREPRDAKFEFSEGDNKANEFQGSRPGIALDFEATYDLINQAILERTWHDEGITKSISLVTERIEPNVKTGDVNDLGITELLGIGTSDFSGSPRNRRVNIQNAVDKLNGILIPSGEQFSTIEFTKPFTIEGGYLAELVIKGDEIKPEIGGGLCQIGTTLFRMAMNSAMDITSRRNHSLVVSYYNDPTNGNPGTDATVYDPAPDFRFKNDTKNYVLLQAQVDWDEQILYFSLWGTNDGRKGYYSNPVVLEWIPYGETKEIETIKIDPGSRECQHAYTGANTTFTYTREDADGKKEERVFESHYRPLPQICLVGVAKTCSPSPDNPDEEVCVPISEVEIPVEEVVEGEEQIEE